MQSTNWLHYFRQVHWAEQWMWQWMEIVCQMTRCLSPRVRMWTSPPPRRRPPPLLQLQQLHHHQPQTRRMMTSSSLHLISRWRFLMNHPLGVFHILRNQGRRRVDFQISSCGVGGSKRDQFLITKYMDDPWSNKSHLQWHHCNCIDVDDTHVENAIFNYWK